MIPIGFAAVFVLSCSDSAYRSWYQETHISEKERDEAQLDGSVALSSPYH
jgi:hypothetical protein